MYEVIKLQIKIRGQYALLHTPFQGSFINPKPLTTHKHSNYHGPTMSFLPSTLLQDSTWRPCRCLSGICSHGLDQCPPPVNHTTATVSNHSLDSHALSRSPMGLLNIQSGAHHHKRLVSAMLPLLHMLFSVKHFFHSSKCSAKNQRSTSLNS